MTVDQSPSLEFRFAVQSIRSAIPSASVAEQMMHQGTEVPNAIPTPKVTPAARQPKINSRNAENHRDGR
jgi:hypothetical protein